MSVYIMAGARCIGDVTLGENANIWYNSVLRGDLGSISIGANTNVQDNCVLHVDAGQALRLGNGVSVGHSCVLHGCTVEDGVLVGMGSIVMDGAVLQEGCIIGAGSLVTRGTVIPKGMLAHGRPAKPVRPASPEEIIENRQHALDYVETAKKQVQQHAE